MTSFDLQPILEALEKPLLYASGNEYANLKTLKGVEPYFGHWFKKASALSLSPREQDHFHRLSSLLAGFDQLDLPLKKARILELQGILEELKREDASPQDTPPAPVVPLLTLEDFREKQKALKTPLQSIKGVGPHISSIFKKKNILTVEDALYLLPRFYVDRRQIKKIAQTDVGQVETVMGTVLDAELTFMGRRRIFQVKIGDSTGVITAKWFHFNPRFMKGRFQKGMEVILSGEVRLFHFQKEMDHPELDILKGKDPEGNLDDSLHYGRIIPIYSETEGLYQRQRLIRRIWKNAVDQFAPQAESGIPEDICRRQKLMPLPEALRKAHFPDGEDPIALLNEGRSPAHRRLVFDEFFFLELGLALRRSGTLMEKGISFPIAHRLTRRLRELLLFQFTPAQERVTAEIEADMRKPVPMNRLLQGDVGSGKTIVALMACLMAIEGGYQAALMAPTEILAEQHFLNIRPLLDSLGLRAILLTGSRKKSAREETLKELASDRIHLAIGTHALIQEGIHFKNLGLVIIDEQHKFGVIQRAALKRKGYQPDVLVMTATPIPRTLAMTFYGDLDISVIDQLPPGRGAITTKVFHQKERFRVYRLLREEISKGKQAYVVYPLVEESEQLDLKDATQMAKSLQRDIFPEFKVGLVHGQMKSEEKEAVMADFKAGRIHLLVSTIVIEVGIDVSNASVMVIEHAERFGLSQLHQLRGRVGRGKAPSHCLLIAKDDKSDEARRRLRVMEETTDGFKIAEEDLAIRGPGELLGTQQSGLPDFRVANFFRDFSILTEARNEAFAVITRDPLLSLPEHQMMKETLRDRWQGRLELAMIG